MKLWSVEKVNGCDNQKDEAASGKSLEKRLVSWKQYQAPIPAKTLFFHRNPIYRNVHRSTDMVA